MVEANNAYRCLNEPVIDGYFRSVDETRKAVENAHLPIISHFVSRTEAASEPVRLPSRIFEEHRPYLNRLAHRYLKRDFEFSVDPAEGTLIYDSLATLVRHARKAYQYILCDFNDFVFSNPELFLGVTIPYTVAKAVLEEIQEFNHKKPPMLKRIVERGEAWFPLRNVAPHKVRSPTAPLQKFPTAIDLYTFVVENTKRALDFEILKFYDFLVEQPPREVESNKLPCIEERVRFIGEAEYTKRPFALVVAPHREGTAWPAQDRWLDEWAGNIRKVLEARDQMARELLQLSAKAPALEQRVQSSPELAALILTTPH